MYFVNWVIERKVSKKLCKWIFFAFYHLHLNPLSFSLILVAHIDYNCGIDVKKCLFRCNYSFLQVLFIDPSICLFCQSVHWFIHLSLIKFLRHITIADFKVKMFLNDLLNNGWMSNDKVVLSDVTPWYLLFLYKAVYVLYTHVHLSLCVSHFIEKWYHCNIQDLKGEGIPKEELR